MNALRVKNWLAALGLALILAGMAGGSRAALPDPTRFGVAIETGDVRAARAWLDQGLPPDFLADRIGTGLMIAAWEGNIAMMELFASRGANINAVNTHGEQALLHAAWKGRIDAVKWLIEHGARVNRTGLAWSALHYAAFSGHEDVARLLLERGADINARSTNGSTPLMMTAREGQEKLAKMLVERGADTGVKNDWGEDALVWAMRHGHIDIAKAVSSPARFAEAARQPPESFGAPVRSVRIPDKIEELIEEMRLAQAGGRLTPELQQAYLLAVRQLRAGPATAAAPADESPRALEIRARRAAPEQESAVLIYDSGWRRESARGAPMGGDEPVQR